MKTQLIVALTLLVPSIYLTGCSTVLSEKIESVSHGVDVGEEKLVYRVYLPPSYEAEPNRQFPLLVWFHGGGGNEKTWGKVGGIGERLLQPMSTGEWPEFIVVSPTVGEFDVYNNGDDEALINKVLPRVNREYRTNGVTLAYGHSMGGLNALMVTLRHPEKFDGLAVASPFAFDTSPYDCELAIEGFEKKFGAGWQGVYRRGIKSYFGNKQSFDAYDPFTQVRRTSTLPFPVLLTSGTRDGFGLFPHNQHLHQMFVRSGISHDWLVQKDVGHGTVVSPAIYEWLEVQAGIAAKNKAQYPQPERTAGGR